MMLKLSRFILCVLIVISFLYKSVCSSHEIENDDPNLIWKNNNSKDLVTLIDLFNFVSEDNEDGPAYHRISKEPWMRSPRSPPLGSRNDYLSNEVSDDILNSPLHQLDLGEIQKFPRIRDFFIRNGNKRNLEFNPRLGRAAHSDNCVELVKFRPPYAPRLGKKSYDNFSPRLGRHCSETFDRRK